MTNASFQSTDSSNDVVYSFLEYYQAEPLIWDPKHKFHKDRKKLNYAWELISKEMKIPVPVLKKITALMATFSQHLRRKKSSIKSGAGTEDVYKPIWFAYDIMESFLLPVYTANQTINTESQELFSLRNFNYPMALRGIKVLEIAGLAPAPFCGMVLADFGASVVRVDKTEPTPDIDCLSNGKRSVAINLKTPKGVEVFKKLCFNADVLIEPFRKGVMEKLDLGPSVIMSHNPRIVYARLSGFGQKGDYSERVGHDINFVSMSGLLSLLGEQGRQPNPPINLAADFGGGGLVCALGIVLALLARQTSGAGQVVDCGMVGGTAYLASWLMRSQSLPIWGQPRGCNILDGGVHFYTTYETKDGRWMAVGALEPQFYNHLVKGLDLEHVPQFPDDSAECKRIFADKFKEKTQQEWCQIFERLDACVTPVLSLSEAATHPHNVANHTFAVDQELTTPNPAPKLSHTPGQSQTHLSRPRAGQHTREVLGEAGLATTEIQELVRSGVVRCTDSKL